ncbi:unnamed protein product [Owenia fusiformis]|uniref:Vacuolar ATPase assembly protein VMA22 n=1 Tax=Owenia fusiformis TaxID=6347 RepID=A0A8J1U8A3_OWEFU|nr:unnamed protein product [Owenia fusiformis]
MTMPENVASEYHEVCGELDNITLKVFDVLSQLNETRQSLESTLKDGYFLMSKARYSMGNKSVSTVQYNEKEMVASALVDVYTESMFDTDAFKFELTGPNDTTTAEIDKEKTAVRKRNIKSTVDDVTRGIEELNVKKDESDLKSKESKSNDDNTVDPIKWFGVLVPQALKQSQACFKKVLTSSCEISSLQNELMALKHAYKDKMKQKMSLQANSAET